MSNVMSEETQGKCVVYNWNGTLHATYADHDWAYGYTGQTKVCRNCHKTERTTAETEATS